LVATNILTAQLDELVEEQEIKEKELEEI